MSAIHGDLRRPHREEDDDEEDEDEDEEEEEDEDEDEDDDEEKNDAKRDDAHHLRRSTSATSISASTSSVFATAHTPRHCNKNTKRRGGGGGGGGGGGDQDGQDNGNDDAAAEDDDDGDIDDGGGGDGDDRPPRSESDHGPPRGDLSSSMGEFQSWRFCRLCSDGKVVLVSKDSCHSPSSCKV